jgi:acyl-CoA synthetase (AMP-forming)/AMP-acid ligase II
MNGKDTTFAEFWQKILNVESASRRMGLIAGETFIFAAKPDADTLAVAIGLLKAGLRLAFIDPFTAIESFERRVELVKPDVVIADSRLYLLGNPKLRWLRRILNLNIVDYGSIKLARHFTSGLYLFGAPRGSRRIEEFGAQEARNEHLSNPNPDADAVIVFTSGTTGDPKGVVHSIGSLSASFDATAEAFGFKPGEVLLCEPLTVGLVALCRGVTWCLPEKSLPKHFDKFFGVPTDVLKLLNKLEAEPTKAATIKLIGMGGAPVLPSLINRIHQVVSKDVTTLCVYGMTEILPVAIAHGEEKLEDTSADILGRPVPGVELSFAEDREILVRGPGLMKGYLGKQPSAWHATGDLGYMDDKGRLMLLGRKKNMLIRGDMNIYPSLYEPGICTIDGVADAVIVGVPDEIGDDRVVLFVVPSDADTKRAELIERLNRELPIHMDRQALPDKIEIIEKLPVSGRGQKRDMVELQKIATALIEKGIK